MTDWECDEPGAGIVHTMCVLWPGPAELVGMDDVVGQG